MNAQSQFGDLQHQKIFLLFSRHAFHATQPSLEMILELEVDGAAVKAGPTERRGVSLYPSSVGSLFLHFTLNEAQPANLLMSRLRGVVRITLT